MFSGKSTELLRRIQRYVYAGHKTVLIKHASDDRYNKNNVVTHDQISNSALSVWNLKDALNIIEENEIIGIDEGQFVSKKL